jgi:hypothetical protein
LKAKTRRADRLASFNSHPSTFNYAAPVCGEQPVSQIAPKLFTDPRGEQIVQKKGFNFVIQRSPSSRSLIEQSKRGGLK